MRMTQKGDMRKVLSLMEGVSIVKTVETPNNHITQTKGYKEAIDDILNGRVSELFCSEEYGVNHLAI